jgi:fluoroacetyl-CoA thioesterase
MIEQEFTVTEADTALAVGSGGLPVLATPRLVAMVEEVCFKFLETQMKPEQTTVGTKFFINHLAASGVGATIRISCEEQSRDKTVEFTFQAYEKEQLLATGTHRRAVVDQARFLKKITNQEG